MTRTEQCAGGDGLITKVRRGPWDDEAWEHDDGTRYRDGHRAQPAPECPACGSPKLTFETADPWTEKCLECGTVHYPRSEDK